MSRLVLHNYLPLPARNIGRFRATAPARDHGEDGTCHCGGSCDTCKIHGHDEATSKADAYMYQVCAALNSYSPHVQQQAKAQFSEGASVQEAVKHIRRSNGAFDSQYSKAELGIDVVYMKGGYGRPKITETRHYTVPNVEVDPRGHAPQSAFVMGQLRTQPEHKGMLKDGWSPEKVEGYYKREQRDVSRKPI